jgi:hypothetical protein
VRLGKFKIFTYVKPSDTATMFSHRIAKYVSEKLDAPLCSDETIGKSDLDTLIVIAGGSAFCGCRDALGRAVLRSERVIFCTNDYKSKLPLSDSAARSPYRRAFVKRARAGMAPIDHWSIVPERAAVTPGSALVNWNMLAWYPAFEWRGTRPTLFYYGSMRKGRESKFDHWFSSPYRQTVISNRSGKFETRYPQCAHLDAPYSDLHDLLCEHGAGLYLVDGESTAPADSCRFYEMLGAGMPMLFDTDSVAPMMAAGYDVAAHSVGEPSDVRRLMSARRDVAAAQSQWRADFRKIVGEQFEEAAR